MNVDSSPKEMPQAADDLRLQGNTAFVAKDWTTAVEKYQQSNNIDGKSKQSAKVYSNLAAALCKLNKYDEAHKFAKLATEVDPDWAKGYWRLGVVSELQKDFCYALKYYDCAVKLAPDEAIFKKAQAKALDRLGYEGKKEGGLRVIRPPPGSLFDMTEEMPFYISWSRFKKATNDLTKMENAFPKYFNILTDEDIKSDKWIAQGMYQWYSAMVPSISALVKLLPPQNPEMARINSQLDALAAVRDKMTTEEYKFKQCMITDSPPLQGNEFQTLMNAVTFLSGDHIPVEGGGGKFIPSPKWLTWYPPQHMLAITNTLFYQTVHCMGMLEDKDGMVMSPAVLSNQANFWDNTGSKASEKFGKEGSPEEVMEYCKKKLMEGITWDKGMRQFVSLIYRGTVLHGFQLRMMGELATALRNFKWGRQFIQLADDEWNVSAERTYKEKGTCFRKSFQVCILSMELTTARTIRSSPLPTKEAAEYEFKLAQDIINIAKNTPLPSGNVYQDWMMDVAFRRKPLANACTHLASTMNSLMKDVRLLSEIIESTGLTEFGRDDNLFSFIDETVTQTTDGNLNSLIAETYKHAAVNQLGDDNEATILWWGYAAHMSQAGGYRIKDLRKAINNAVASSQKRDSELFGPEIWKGSAFQKQALMLANYYECKGDDFVLPPIIFSPRPDGSISLFVDGQLLCMNFDKQMRSEAKRFEHKRPDKMRDAYFDTSELEKEHVAG